MTDLVYLSCMILLPIVPAFLLFKALRSAGDVSGPLLGLRIKLGGAFAGYFAVLVLLFVMYHVWHPTYGVWSVHGTVTDDSGRPLPSLDVTNFTLIPGNLTVYDDGSFDMTFSAANGAWPTLSVNYPNYMSHPVVLDPTSMQKEKTGAYIIPNISFTKLPSYTGAGVAASPVAAVPEHQP
jgi:hypothetical protein